MVNNETLGYKTFRKGKLEYGEGRKAECSAQNWRDESWAEKRGAGKHCIGKHWQTLASIGKQQQQQQKVFVNTRSSSSLRKGPKAAYWNRLDLTVGDNQGRRIFSWKSHLVQVQVIGVTWRFTKWTATIPYILETFGVVSRGIASL